MPRVTEKNYGRAQAIEDAKSGKPPEPLIIPPTHTTCSRCNRLLFREDVDENGLGEECRGEQG